MKPIPWFLALWTVLALTPPELLAAQTVAAQPPSLVPPLATRRLITADMLAKMLGLIASTGTDSQLPANIAVALGVEAAGAPWPVRQFAVESHADGSVHAMAVNAVDDADILLSVRGPAAISIFRARRDGTLVSAVYFFPETKQSASMFPAEAKSAFAAECVFWATNLDGLTSGG